jgi:glycosyltransferase involved in cell wall biosynthesis
MSIGLHLERTVSEPRHRAGRPDHAPPSPLSLLMATRYGRLGASSRLRLLQYEAPLAEAGILSTARPFFPDSYVRALYGAGPRLRPTLAAYAHAAGLARAIREHDLIWIEKELLPFIPAMLERRLLDGRPFVLDFDDPWFLRYEQSGNPLIRLMLGGKFASLLRRAALTIVANEALENWAVESGACHVLRLPTVVDLDLYPVLPEPPAPFTIGWIGTPVTAPYLASIAGPLRQLAAEAPLELLVIGAPDLVIPGVICRHEHWSEATEAASIARCHVGIMPLPDDEWARGKSGYKLIQYMAAGRPTVASPVGANRSIVREGETGFLAADASAWCDRLRRLRDDAALRQRMGSAARSRAARNYSLQVTAPRLAGALRNLVVARP